MDGITRIQPLLDDLNGKNRNTADKVGDPALAIFLDYIDKSVAEHHERNKLIEAAAIEQRAKLAKFDKELAFLQGKVEAALQAMQSVPKDCPSGTALPEKNKYYYWLSQLQSFKQSDRMNGV